MAVRIAAARALVAAPIAQDPRGPWHLASGEWRASLWAKADFPETHMVIGGTALVLRDPPAAERAFREALRQDPQLIDAWTMVIRIRAAVGDREGAHAATLEALGVNPNDPALVSMLAQFDEVP